MKHLTVTEWGGLVIISGTMVTMGHMDTEGLTINLTMGPIMDLTMDPTAGLTVVLMELLTLKDVPPGWGPVPT